MRHITKNDLLKILIQTKGATFATILLESDPKMRKTDNPYFGAIKKLSKYNVCVNFSYENSVNLQRSREDKRKDFKAMPTWGEHLTPSVILNNGQHYLHCKLEKRLETKYINRQENEEIPAGLLTPWLPKKNSSSRQKLKKEIICIRPKLDNIKGITIHGESYIIL